MIANKTVCKIKQPLIFLLLQYIDTFVAIVSVFFVDTISVTDIISSHSITEVSAIIFKYLLFSQIHVLGFQL